MKRARIGTGRMSGGRQREVSSPGTDTSHLKGFGMSRKWLIGRMGCVFLVVSWWGCAPVTPGGNGNDNSVFDRDADPAVVAEVETLMRTIEEYGEQFDALLRTTDVTSAAEQVAAALAAEPEVEWAVGDAQGVALLFRNGMQAALFEDLLDDEPGIPEPPEEFEDLDLTSAKSVKDSSPETMVRLPGSKKTVFLNPHNWERQAYATKLVQKSNARFDEVGMDRFVVYLGEQCTLDRLSALSAYGVVHFYSHGAPFPRRNNIQETYLMTGEIADAVTTAVLKDLGLWGSVLQGRTTFKRATDAEPAKHVMYFVNPRYLTEFNNFATSRPLVYLGFCFSWRGSWQATLTGAGVSDAVGFDWAVKTKWNAWWGRALYHKLGDKSLDEPMTIQGWYNLLRDRDRRSYVYTDDNKTPDDPLDDVQRTVTVYYDGASDFTLWEKEPEPVTFADTCLVDQVRCIVNKYTGELTAADYAEVTGLERTSSGIRSLQGIQLLTNLEYLEVSGNEITDLTPLASLTKLRTLILVENEVSDLSPLRNIPSLEVLDVRKNHVSDLSPLSALPNLLVLSVDFQKGEVLSDLSPIAGLTTLTELNASGNRVADISALAGLTNAWRLSLAYNSIIDVSPLGGLPAIQSLWLNSNPVVDIGPLASNDGIGEGDYIVLDCTMLDYNCDASAGSTAQCAHRERMEARGADVVWGLRGYCETDPVGYRPPAFWPEHGSCETRCTN